MNRRMNMRNVREILSLVHEGNLSNRQIAKSCNCSPTTVTAIIERKSERVQPEPDIFFPNLLGY
ncbi:winged helix-turn-helix transcriptional regulator [Thermoanaerobacteraceae bacterium SP2]|nr:winged helix-turn-helix transcriptional regulator [Thermoanaerobacteraceae bacterium SP2]